MHAILKKNSIILGGVKMDFEKKLEELGFVLPVDIPVEIEIVAELKG